MLAKLPNILKYLNKNQYSKKAIKNRSKISSKYSSICKVDMSLDVIPLTLGNRLFNVDNCEDKKLPI
jgi:formylmethanofuran dehydrogenase subunit A